VNGTGTAVAQFEDGRPVAVAFIGETIDDPIYREYEDRFASYDDDKLVDAFNRDVGKPGWVREAGFVFGRTRE
jgi:hypothetical protein